LVLVFERAVAPVPIEDVRAEVRDVEVEIAVVVTSAAVIPMPKPLPATRLFSDVLETALRRCDRARFAEARGRRRPGEEPVHEIDVEVGVEVKVEEPPPEPMVSTMYFSSVAAL
jgi:hypothetical protein